MCGFCEREVELPERGAGFRIPFRAALAASLVLGLALLLWLRPWHARLATPEELKADAGRMQSLLRSNKVSDSSDMDFMYRYVRSLLQIRSVTIRRPISTFWVTLDVIKKKQGPDAKGYTESFHLNDGAVVSMNVYVPVDMPAITAVHSMAHELGHCWQYDNAIASLPPQKREGFCEWVAWHALNDLHVTDPQIIEQIRQEMDSISTNAYEDYSAGFEQFERIEKKDGPGAVFAQMRNAR